MIKQGYDKQLKTTYAIIGADRQGTKFDENDKPESKYDITKIVKNNHYALAFVGTYDKCTKSLLRCLRGKITTEEFLRYINAKIPKKIFSYLRNITQPFKQKFIK